VSVESNKKIHSAFHQPLSSSRFVQVDGDWYFATRESGICGPYQSYSGAVEGLHIHLSNLNNDTCKATVPNALEVEEIDSKNLLFWR
jgi:hypothetical protein